MGWARRHNGFDKYKIGLPNVRHAATKEIYRIFSWRLMDWAPRHSGFGKYIMGLLKIKHTAKK